MKSLFIGILIALSTSSAFARTDIGQILAQDPNKTPFQALEELFNQAHPIALSELPTIYDRDLNKYFAMIVTPSVSREEVKTLNILVVQYQAKVVNVPGRGAIPAKPGVPANGPLFPAQPPTPAVPAVPPQYNTVSLFIGIPNDGSFKSSPEEIGQQFRESRAKIEMSPDLKMTFLYDSRRSDSTFTETVRQIDGLVILKGEYENWFAYEPGTHTFDGHVSYSYFWKNP